jgi:uncharacterized protein (TIGR01777 family)
MKILLAGASGLVGTALGAALERDGHTLLRATRGTARDDSMVHWDPVRGEIESAKLAGLDAAVNLAGENIGSRWTDERKKTIVQSRTLSTKLLAESLAALERKPRVFLSASAIGFYGDRGTETLHEGSAMGEGFLAETCRDWEAETRFAQRAGIRTAQLRFGVILSKRGGALAKMLLPFRLGLGGRVGSGKQYMSFVSLADVIAAIRFVLSRDDLAGPINVVAPNPVDNAEFTRALGRALRRPTIFPFPAFAVRLLFGEMGDHLMLRGQRVEPKRLKDSGFEFAHPTIDAALGSALNDR